MDRNLPYLVATRLLPPYDLRRIQIDNGLPSYYLSQWPGNVGTDDQSRPDPRSCTTQGPDCAYIKTDWPGTVSHPNFGIVPAWTDHLSVCHGRLPASTWLPAGDALHDRLIVGSARLR